MMENSLYPGSIQIEPMKYGNKPSEAQILKSWESGEWVAQEKKDGAWYQLEKTDNGEIYLFGRTVSKKTGEYTEKIANVPHIKSWATYLPNGTTVIGEIYIPGGKSNDVTKIMGCTATNAYTRQFESDAYGGPIHYYIFDCIRYRGKSLLEVPFIDRYEHYLEYELYDCFELGNYIGGYQPLCEYVELAPLYENNFEEHLKNIFSAGGEGMVFKHKQSLYRPGARTSPLKEAYKYKEHLDSIDLVCMELLDPVWEYTGKEIENWPYWMERAEATAEGKFDWIPCGRNCYKDSLANPHIFKAVTKPAYNGWKNAMRLGAYRNGELVEVCRVASGLTDELREDMANNPEAYLGKVIEIECMSVNKKDGTVRHPCFKNIRSDKNPEDCIYKEIFG